MFRPRKQARGLLRVQVVPTLASPPVLGKPDLPLQPVVSERGVANLPTNPCSRSMAVEGLLMFNERGAQHCHELD